MPFAHADRLGHVEVLGGLDLEGLRVRPEDELSALQNLGVGLLQLRDQTRVLRLDVDERDHGRKASLAGLGWSSRSVTVFLVEQRSLGTQGLVVSAMGLGCMGMSEFYGARRRRRVDRDDPPRARARRDLPRHGRHVRAVHQRGARRPRASPAAATRSCSRRSSASSRDRRRRSAGSTAAPEYVRSACEALAARLGVDAHRPLLPAPRRPDRADRGDRRRDGRARRGGQGALPRPLRGGRRDDPPRARRASDQRAAERVLAVDARSRGRASSRACRELGIGFVAYSPLGRGFLTGQIRSRRRPRRRRLPPPLAALPGRQLREEPRARRRASTRSPPRRAARRRSSRSPGCWRRATDIVPIPGTKRRTYLEENVAAATIELTPSDLARLDEAAPHGVDGGRPLPGHEHGQPLARCGGATSHATTSATTATTTR